MRKGGGEGKAALLVWDCSRLQRTQLHIARIPASQIAEVQAADWKRSWQQVTKVQAAGCKGPGCRSQGSQLQIAKMQAAGCKGSNCRLQRTQLQVAKGAGLWMSLQHAQPQLCRDPAPTQQHRSRDPASNLRGGRRQKLEVSISAEIWHLPPLWQPH